MGTVTNEERMEVKMEEDLERETEVSSPNQHESGHGRKIAVAIVTCLFVVAAGVALYSGFTDSETADAREHALAMRRKSCASTNMYITCRDWGRRLQADTSSPSSAVFVSESTTSRVKFTVQQVGSSSGSSSGKGTFTIKNPLTGEFLDSSSLKFKSGVATDPKKQWTIENKGCASGGDYYYIKSVDQGKYMNAGLFYPSLVTKTSSNKESLYHYITSSSGSSLCGITQSICPKQCKTGVKVDWAKATSGSSSGSSSGSGSVPQSVKDKALRDCNSHCKACSSWDVNCKKCGGTLDSGKITTQSSKTMIQCDCNAAFKAAAISMVAVAVILANIKNQF